VGGIDAAVHAPLSIALRLPQWPAKIWLNVTAKAVSIRSGVTERIGNLGGGERLAVTFENVNDMYLLQRIELMLAFEKSPERWHFCFRITLG
jgi:hypothetical protein